MERFWRSSEILFSRDQAFQPFETGLFRVARPSRFKLGHQPSGSRFSSADSSIPAFSIPRPKFRGLPRRGVDAVKEGDAELRSRAWLTGTRPVIGATFPPWACSHDHPVVVYGIRPCDRGCSSRSRSRRSASDRTEAVLHHFGGVASPCRLGNPADGLRAMRWALSIPCPLASSPRAATLSGVVPSIRAPPAGARIQSKEPRCLPVRT